jgi:hypothetical protein
MMRVVPISIENGRASTGTIKGEENYYEAPTMERSPEEVFQVLQVMDKAGVKCLCQCPR